jgi:hypothetical protein
MPKAAVYEYQRSAPGKTRSGLPGSLGPCRRNRSPLRCRYFLTASSGNVFRLRIRLIFRLRASGLSLSIVHQDSILTGTAVFNTLRNKQRFGFQVRRGSREWPRIHRLVKAHAFVCLRTIWRRQERSPRLTLGSMSTAACSGSISEPASPTFMILIICNGRHFSRPCCPLY